MRYITPRLLLRPPMEDDVEPLYAIYGDAATNTFNPVGPLPDVGSAQAVLSGWRTQWRTRGLGPWAIAARDDPARVLGFGGISLHPYLEQERVNLGYRFATSAWGRGYATELGKAALAFGFDEHRFNQIFGLVRPQHAASIRVLEKIGMARFDTLDDVPGQAPSLVYRAVNMSSGFSLAR